MAASMKDMKRGWGLRTVLEYSGWYWVPMYQRLSASSMTSARPLSGLTPAMVMPAASKRSRYSSLNSKRWRCRSSMSVTP